MLNEEVWQISDSQHIQNYTDQLFKYVDSGDHLVTGFRINIPDVSIRIHWSWGEGVNYDFYKVFEIQNIVFKYLKNKLPEIYFVRKKINTKYITKNLF